MNKYIPADKLVAEIERQQRKLTVLSSHARQLDMKRDCALQNGVYLYILSIINSLQQEQPEVELDKLVNEEFASHCRTTEYGLVATYNRAELYQLIKRMALVFNARNEVRP